VSARDGAVRITDKQGRDSHVHAGCGHSCTCYIRSAAMCRDCKYPWLKAVLAKRYPEDNLTTEQLLERRS
jgi:hypothetical protein